MAKKATPTSNLSSDKAKAVEAAIAQIEKNYGKGSIMALGQQPVEDIPVIPSGCIQLDMALGVGGFPRGRIIEIYGPESSGKTTLALHAIAEAQKLGFRRMLLPAPNMKGLDPRQYDIQLVPVRRVVEAVRELFG